MNRMSFIITILSIFPCTLPALADNPISFYISPSGQDGWSGRLPSPNADKTDGPFTTLEKARDTIRALRQEEPQSKGPITINLTEGIYLITQTLELTALDSGVIWQGVPGHHVCLQGGPEINNLFQPVTDAETRGRFDDDVRDKILQADLKSLGEIPSDLFTKKRSVALELFFLGQPMPISRWPDERYAEIDDVTDEIPTDIRGRTGSKAGKIIFNHRRLKQWKNENCAWLHGFWFWDWADSYQKITGIDLDKTMIYLADPQHYYGYRPGQRFYALNIFYETDTPGEWNFNPVNKMLYFYPPAAISQGPAIISLLSAPMISLQNADHIILKNLTFECSLAVPVTINSGEHNQIAGCTFRNLAARAVAISEGTDNSIQSCDIYNTGTGGITLSGGDRKTLTPANHAAVNNHISFFSRWRKTGGSAISVAGVGNRVANNLIHDAPHLAIDLAGNDHIIELNEIHHVGLETNDAGAFYMGRNWSQRGNVVRYNYFHDLGTGDFQAVYLDDFTCGTAVIGNICCHVRRGVLVGGGRDNIVQNNIFYQCKQGVHIDQRGIGWAKDYFDGSDTTLVDHLNAVNGDQPPYSTKYPPLASILNDQPALAKGNKVVRNIVFRCDRWLDLCDGLTEQTPYLTFENNSLVADPGFVNPGKGDFRLKADSPVFTLGFEPIPTDRIGLYNDEYRTQPK